MSVETSGQFDVGGRAALSLMEQALALLDGCGGGNDAGAHLDLAICRLRVALGLGSADTPDANFSADPRLDPDAVPWSRAS